MKEKLREALPLSLKLLAKRAAVGAVRLPVRAGARALKLARRIHSSATAHGLDMHRDWDVQTSPGAQYAQQFGATDFLFLMDAAAGRKDRTPAPNRPVKTSIILLCYNKIELTFQCLRSLLREVDLKDTEIIVVNNASVDSTKEVLSYFDGYIRALNNEENLGFVHGNNAGAKLARGEHLVFLNNDTVVLPGWLENMVETAEADPKVGVVGPMLLYPDFTLQEAGGIVWKDGSASHYGWGGSPDDRRFNFAREVDYVIGASLLIRRELFERLGGFDSLYAPIYYEDVDICFGARSLGYKVVYQPLSRILHFEGATTGTDTRFGLKRFQIVNREKFREKRREELESEQYAYDPASFERAANRKSGPYVLVIDERLPTPDRDAGSARMVAILKALTRWSKPVFIPISKQEWPEEEKRLWKMGVETARIVDYKRLVKERDFHAAILSRPQTAKALLPSIRRADPRIKIVFDMVDAHFVRLEREYEVTRDESLRKKAASQRKVEAKLARASDLVWCASPEDMRALESVAPGARMEVVPTIHCARANGKSFDERNGLLFVGNMRHRPNSDGVLFFLNEVFPLIREKLPEARVTVIGDHSSPEIASLASERVRVMGYVPDVEPHFNEARVFVAPLRFGAGVKGKIGEAMAHGLPVVTTAIGAEGMGIERETHALIEDDARAFADAVARLYRDENLWRKLSGNGRALVEKRFSPEAVEETIRRSLKEIGEFKN